MAGLKEKEVIKMLSQEVGLYQKVWGKLLDNVARDDDIEELKYILTNIAGFTDVEEVVGKKLDRRAMKENTKILLNYTGDERERQ